MPLDPDAEAALLVTCHRMVDDVADDTILRVTRIGAGDHGPTVNPLDYPPNMSCVLADTELTALAAVAASPEAMSALRKLTRAAAAMAMFRLFYLLDGEIGLDGTDRWHGVDLREITPADGGRVGTVHHRFYDAYLRYDAD